MLIICIYSTALGAEIRSGRAGRVYSRRSPQIWVPKWSFWGVLAKTPQKPPFWGGPEKPPKMAKIRVQARIHGFIFDPQNEKICL